MPRQVPWRLPNGGSSTAAGSTKKITNSAQKPIFCALFYSQGPPIPSTDAEFYSRRSTSHFTSPAPPASEHKNPNFVLETPENEGSRPQKRTKTSILCSKRPKTGVPKPKSAQKPRFCARNARKWGSRRQKAHKNPDFVLENPKNGGSEDQKRTKNPILCSGRMESGIEREEIGIGTDNRGLPANHRARFQNANAS